MLLIQQVITTLNKHGKKVKILMREKKKVLQFILQSKVEQFVFDYLNNAKALYFDDAGNLIHPGEFGMYREKICIDLLKDVVPMRLDFGTGFIIDSTGNVSHQCDIIIFDANNTPLIENNEKQRFFPIECVVAVGEVKSDLSKTKLKEALQKLSNVKAMRLNIEKNRSIIYECVNNTRRDFLPLINPRDQLFTFLICDSLEFKTDNLVNELDDLYGEIDKKFRHNMILSVRDGAFMYVDEKKKAIYYPSIGNTLLKHCEIKPYEDVGGDTATFRYAHIYSFLNYMYQGIAAGTIMYPELSYYISEGLHKNIVVENDN